MKIQNTKTETLIELFKSLSDAFGINKTTDQTYYQVAEYMKENYKLMEADRIKKALHYWARNESSIRPPKFLNSYFISQIISFHKKNLDNISNNHLQSGFDRPLQFTKEQKRELSINHYLDMTKYLKMALDNNHNHMLNERSLSIIDDECLEYGIYDESDFNHIDILEMQKTISSYFTSRNVFMKGNKSFRSIIIGNVNIVVNEKMSRACYFMINDKDGLKYINAMSN